MIERLVQYSRGSVGLAFRGLVVGALALTIGIGWHALSTQAASVGLSAPSDQAYPAESEEASASVSSTAVFTLTVLHTNDTWGYVDPCG